MSHPESLANKVRQLLAEDKLSQRQIAIKLGVSRGFVDRIAAGKRPDYEGLRRAREEELQQTIEPPRRCPGCRHLIHITPCVECKTRRAMAESPKLRKARRPTDFDTVDADAPLKPDLTEKQQARYEKIRDRRMRLGEDYREQ